MGSISLSSRSPHNLMYTSQPSRPLPCTPRHASSSDVGHRDHASPSGTSPVQRSPDLAPLPRRLKPMQEPPADSKGRTVDELASSKEARVIASARARVRSRAGAAASSARGGRGDASNQPSTAAVRAGMPARARWWRVLCCNAQGFWLD